MATEHIYAFLTDLAANNNKQWFDANKPRYEAVRADFVAFVQACIVELSSRMALEGIEAKKCIYRINRDVRFSKNKDPYKSNFACFISTEGKNATKPGGIYISLSPTESFVGMGLYDLSAEQLKAVRQEIDYNLEAWKKIVHARNFLLYFIQVQGERLKTTPKGYDAANPALEWLQLKQFYVGYTPQKDLTLQTDFVQHIGKVADAGSAFARFLSDALAEVKSAKK